MGEIAIELTASWVAKAVAIKDDFPTPDYWWLSSGAAASTVQ